MEKSSFFVTELDASQRIDKYLKKMMPSAPLNFIYKLLRTKDVRVNNKKVPANYILNVDDEIIIFLTSEQKAEFITPYAFFIAEPTFGLIYEDDNILVVNKPAGLLVHPTSAEKVITLTNMVLTYFYKQGRFDPAQRGYIPSPVSRIDEETSGVVIFAKKLAVHQQLANAFTCDNALIRTYRLVVYGILSKDSGTIDLSLSKSAGIVHVSATGKVAQTTYKVLKRSDHKTYIESVLLTGRQHQIRASFDYIGHPLVGDSKYGEKDSSIPLHLNAYSLSFTKLVAPLDYLNGQTFIADNTKFLLKTIGE